MYGWLPPPYMHVCACLHAGHMYARTPPQVTFTAPPPQATNGNQASVGVWRGFPANASFSVTLNAGETYFADTPTGKQIEGALVTSTKPVSVTSGGRGGNCGGCADEGATQAMPTGLWGTQFALGDYPTTSLEYAVVISDTDGTDVTVAGVNVTRLNAGEFYKVQVSFARILYVSYL